MCKVWIRLARFLKFKGRIPACPEFLCENYYFSLFMKKIFLSFIAPVMIAGMLVSCNKNQPDPIVITIDAYTAGNEFNASTGKTVPVVYHDDKELYRLDEGCSITGVASINGDLYACGYRIIANEPVLWKNGALSNIENEGRLLDMASNGTDWVCCGYVEVESERYGVIYKNGAEFYRHNEPSVFSEVDMGASGDYYVTSTSDSNLALLRINASSTSVSQTTVITEDSRYEPTDLYVGLSDICVSLMQDNIDYDKACCWLSRYNEIVPLSDRASTAYNITIFNGAVFVGGSILADDNFHHAVQWINGMAEDYSYECNPGGSCVKLLKSTEAGIFEAVQSPGQIQICGGGTLLGKINCAPNFEAKAWDVVVSTK